MQDSKFTRGRENLYRLLLILARYPFELHGCIRGRSQTIELSSMQEFHQGEHPRTVHLFSVNSFVKCSFLLTDNFRIQFERNILIVGPYTERHECFKI